MDTQELMQVLIPVLVPALVQLAKTQISQLPKWALPYVAVACGVVLEMVRALVADLPTDPVVGGALGLAGVGVREIVDQTRKSASQ